MQQQQQFRTEMDLNNPSNELFNASVWPVHQKTNKHIMHTNLPSLKRISLVIKTSAPDHFAANSSSGENTPKWAVPLLMRRMQSKRSDPITHFMFDFASNMGQFFVAFR